MQNCPNLAHNVADITSRRVTASLWKDLVSVADIYGNSNLKPRVSFPFSLFHNWLNILLVFGRQLTTWVSVATTKAMKLKISFVWWEHFRKVFFWEETDRPARASEKQTNLPTKETFQGLKIIEGVFSYWEPGDTRTKGKQLKVNFVAEVRSIKRKPNFSNIKSIRTSSRNFPELFKSCKVSLNFSLLPDVFNSSKQLWLHAKVWWETWFTLYRNIN